MDDDEDEYRPVPTSLYRDSLYDVFAISGDETGGPSSSGGR